MPVKDTPIFTQTVISAQAVCTAAKTTLNDAANAVLLLTAGVDGALIEQISAKPRATVTATMLQLYKSPDGVVMNLVRTRLMPGHTVQNTTAIPDTDFGYTPSAPLKLRANERLYVGIGVALAGGIVFEAEGGGF